MPNPVARLKENLQARGVDPAITEELEQEYGELVKKLDRMETLLITIVRTGWPRDEEGEPNGIAGAAKPGYVSAVEEARELLGLNLATMITRTEPRTM